MVIPSLYGKSMPMTRLSVNVNKLATLRNSREKNLPDVAKLARKILSYGAHGITVHPRPDGRHIREHDVWEIQALIAGWSTPVEFNIEGYPSEDFMKMIAKAKPHQATLVPDPPEALTSNAGWNLEHCERQLEPILKQLKTWGVRSSIFLDPAQFTRFQGEALARLKPDRIELYTERYADHFATDQRAQVTRDYVHTAAFARDHGIGVNAGHDLNQQNLKYLAQQIPWLDEVSIGHALICEALEEGLETTVRHYLRLLKEADVQDPHAARA